jgi:enoyl-CoA hydratase/carnithine racemase
MDYELIRYDVADGIATITLNRPEKMNALTSQMRVELVDAFDRVDADDAVKVVVMTGAGRAYCAGADISGGSKGFVGQREGGVVNEDGSFNYDVDGARDGGGRLTLRIFQLLKPIICAVNGAAVGIGVTMTLPMDIRLASDKAKFGFVFSRRGIIPEACSSYFLPRVVGVSQALEWCYSGRVFDAQEALAGGLVKAVYPEEELLPAAYALAREIADNAAPVSVALTRQMIWRGLGMSHPMDAHKVDSRGVLSRSASADAKEGVTSFMEKRAPTFPDTVSKDMPDYFPWWEEPQYG